MSRSGCLRRRSRPNALTPSPRVREARFIDFTQLYQLLSQVHIYTHQFRIKWCWYHRTNKQVHQLSSLYIKLGTASLSVYTHTYQIQFFNKSFISDQDSDKQSNPTCLSPLPPSPPPSPQPIQPQCLPIHLAAPPTSIPTTAEVPDYPHPLVSAPTPLHREEHQPDTPSTLPQPPIPSPAPTTTP